MNDARRKSFVPFLEWARIGGMRLQDTSMFFHPGIARRYYRLLRDLEGKGAML
jgi:hypothetical protein